MSVHGHLETFKLIHILKKTNVYHISQMKLTSLGIPLIPMIRLLKLQS